MNNENAMSAALYLPPRLALAGQRAADALVAIAREFSPRVERHGDTLVTLDISGVGRLFGDAREIGEALRRTAADRHLAVHVAVAATRTAALLLARGRAGLTVAAPGAEASDVAPLSLRLLADHEAGLKTGPPAGGETTLDDLLDVLKRWGLKTLGDLAALPTDEVHARLGAEGVRLQRVARGEDARPLVPLVPEEPFEASLELEWPIDRLEPLSFVIGRLCDALSARLERHDCGAAVLHARFGLVTRETLERRLHLPAPMRDPRVLRTLILLDLESYLTATAATSGGAVVELPAGIDVVTIAADPAPGQIVQFSLLERATPSPESLSTLLARLAALMGDGRCGAPALVDSHRPEGFELQPFEVFATETQREGGRQKAGTQSPAPILRRFRHPIPVRIIVEHRRPVRLVTWRRGVSGGRVAQAAGPWRTSGEWWKSSAGGGRRAAGGELHAAWDRDEWDVAIGDGTIYRIHHDRDRDQWFVEGVVD